MYGRTKTMRIHIYSTHRVYLIHTQIPYLIFVGVYKYVRKKKPSVHAFIPRIKIMLVHVQISYLVINDLQLCTYHISSLIYLYMIQVYISYLVINDLVKIYHHACTHVIIIFGDCVEIRFVVSFLVVMNMHIKSFRHT